VSLHSNTYEVDPALCGRSVELVFDAFDLSRIEVRYQGRHMGLAVPQVIGRHSHPKARPEPAAPVAPSGIDYLALVEARHRASAEAAISFADLGAASSDNNSKQAGR
jgi:putative transposase